MCFSVGRQAIHCMLTEKATNTRNNRVNDSPSFMLIGFAFRCSLSFLFALSICKYWCGWCNEEAEEAQIVAQIATQKKRTLRLRAELSVPTKDIDLGTVAPLLSLSLPHLHRYHPAIIRTLDDLVIKLFADHPIFQMHHAKWFDRVDAWYWRKDNRKKGERERERESEDDGKMRKRIAKWWSSFQWLILKRATRSIERAFAWLDLRSTWCSPPHHHSNQLRFPISVPIAMICGTQYDGNSVVDDIGQQNDSHIK